MRKVIQRGIGKSVGVSGNEKVKIGSSNKKFIVDERTAERGMRFFEAEGQKELRQMASGSAKQLLS